MDDISKFSDVEIEAGFLTTVISNPETLDDIIDKVSQESFSTELNKFLFSKIQEQYFEKGTISKVKLMQKALKEYSREKIDHIFDATYMSPVEINQIVDMLNNYRVKRVIKRSLNKSYEHLTNDDLDFDEVKSKIQDEIFEATSEEFGKSLIYDVEDVALESMQRMIERQEGNSPEKIRTGINSLDSMLNGGFSKKHLSILAGRPSMGKTAMSLSILSSIMSTSMTPSLFISLEMDRVKLIDRMLIQKSKVNSDDYYNTKQNEAGEVITEKQRGSIEHARDWIHDKPIKISDQRGLTVKDIKSISRKTDKLFDGELGLIIVDYLTEIKVDATGGRWDKGMAEAIRDLRNLAGEIDCHVLLLHQINRDFKSRGNKRPKLSDLRDTGEAEEKIDNGLLLHRPAYYDSRDNAEDEPIFQDDAELIIAKQREGKTGPVLMNWYPEILYFQDMSDFHQHGKINYL